MAMNVKKDRLSRRFFKNEDGATAIEYCLIGSLIGIGMLVGVSSLGDATDSRYSCLAKSVQSASKVKGCFGTPASGGPVKPGLGGIKPTTGGTKPTTGGPIKPGGGTKPTKGGPRSYGGGGRPTPTLGGPRSNTGGGTKPGIKPQSAVKPRPSFQPSVKSESKQKVRKMQKSERKAMVKKN
ncbi:MAG: Flp family type IVb pilin [Maricaulaceae bacterium]